MLFALSGAAEQGACFQDFHGLCEVCRFLLSNPVFVDRLETLGRGDTSPPSAGAGCSGQMDADRRRRLVGQRVGMRAEAELIRDVNIYVWSGELGDAKDIFDILCLYDADGIIKYNFLGKSLRQALLPFMSGETCILEDPADVQEGDVNKRIEESVHRWLLLRLADMDILQPVCRTDGVLPVQQVLG
jgi:hypothetical protein